MILGFRASTCEFGEDTIQCILENYPWTHISKQCTWHLSLGLTLESDLPLCYTAWWHQDLCSHSYSTANPQDRLQASRSCVPGHKVRLQGQWPPNPMSQQTPSPGPRLHFPSPCLGFPMPNHPSKSSWSLHLPRGLSCWHCPSVVPLTKHFLFYYPDHTTSPMFTILFIIFLKHFATSHMTVINLLLHPPKD